MVLSKPLKDNEYWIRCALALDIHLKRALLYILHNLHTIPGYQHLQGLPKIPAQLYQFLYQHKKDIDKLKKDKVIFNDQYNLLLPASKQCDTDDWDLTLIILVIVQFLNIPPPKGGWKIKNVDPTDTSLAAFVILARLLRNGFKHGTIEDYKTLQKFNDTFDEIRNVLTGLQYPQQDMKEFDELENLDNEHVLIKTIVTDVRLFLQTELKDQEDKIKKDRKDDEDKFKKALKSLRTKR